MGRTLTFTVNVNGCNNEVSAIENESCSAVTLNGINGRNVRCV